MKFNRIIQLPSGRVLGDGQPCFVIAELSGNHNGQLSRALELVNAAHRAGADAVKLQTYTADTMTIESDQPYFRITGDNAWQGRTLYDLYQEAATPWEWHRALFAEARRLGLEVFSTPFDETAVDFLTELDVNLHKIASFELTDHELVRRVAMTGKPVIMSTGMASPEEITESVNVFAETGNRSLILLKCTSAYPSPLSEMNIRAMTTLRELSGTPVGLSDHCLTHHAAVAAVSLGACVIEKHLTLSRADGGPDASFSLEPEEFQKMVSAIRETEEVLGSGILGRGATESENTVFRRSVFAVADIPAGSALSPKNIRVIRPGHGLQPKHYLSVLGRTAKVAISRGTPISWELLEDVSRA